MTNIITDNGQMYTIPGFWSTTGAVIAGSAVQSASEISCAFVAKPLIKEIQKTSQSCDNKVLRSAINDAFSIAALKKNGVEILDLKGRPTGLKRIFKNKSYAEVRKKLNIALNKTLPKFMRNSFYGRMIVKANQINLENGNNVAYIFKDKKIAINIDKSGASAFHEIGHAINHNQSKLWSGVQKLRLPALLGVGLVSITGLLKRKKLDGEQPVNGFDKATTFVKNNVGKLVLALFVPILGEELMATYRGNKIAKKLLPSNMFAKVKKVNRLGAASYIFTALMAAFTAVASSKTRDKLAKPEPLK